MAYTHKKQFVEGGSGNYNNLLLYYGADIALVNAQIEGDDGGKVGFLNVIFNGDEEPKEVTVWAAKDSKGKLCDYVALGWGPHFRETDKSYAPGNLLLRNQ